MIPKRTLRRTRILLILMTMILFIACQQDDDIGFTYEDVSSTNHVVIKNVSGLDIPDIIQRVQNESNKDLAFSLTNFQDGNRSEGSTISGTLDTEIIRQVTNEEGKSNYTFSVTKEEAVADFSIINYVLKEAGNTYYSYFLEFVPDEYWMRTVPNPNDLSLFSGTIRVYDRYGLYVGENIFVNGTKNAQSIRTASCPDDNDNTTTGGDGTTNNDSSDGSDGTSNSDGSDGTGGDNIDIEITCGCSPYHEGGNENPDCECTDPDTIIINVRFTENNEEEIKKTALRNPCPPVEDDCNSQNDCEFGFDANCNCLPNPADEENDSDGVIIDFTNLFDDCDTSKDELKKVFTEAPDDTLELLASLINDFGEDFGIDTKAELDHFLAQAGHETGGLHELGTIENTNYTTVERLLEIFSSFSDIPTDVTNPQKFYAPLYVNDPEAIANAAYCCQLGNGNELSGDGFKYRGRGIFQLTFKGNYQAFQNFYNDEYDPDIDIITNPELLVDNDTLAVLSAMWFYKEEVLDRFTVDSTTSVRKVTRRINRGLRGRTQRENIFNKAKDSLTCQ